jgi:DNA-directed RNA polymerase specialized sigma24 family protein
MASDSEGSVTQLIGALLGDENDLAAEQLWHRYFDRLVRLASGRLRAAPRGAADEEDIALSAFDSFCRGAARGQFPRLGGRDDLWRLLVTITARKAVDHLKKERAQRRGGGRVISEAAVEATDPEAGRWLEQVVGREPTPAFAAQVVDECRRLLEALGDEDLRTLALLRMEGYGNDQIAERLGCGLRSVERKLARIRTRWLAEQPT